MNISPFPDFDEPDLTAEVERLLLLPELEFERVYRAEAAALHVPPATLKRVVSKARRDKDRQEREARKQAAASERLDILRPPSFADFAGFDANEDGIALAFEQKYRQELRFDHDRGLWFFWTAAVWRADTTSLAFSWARLVCRDTAHQLGADDRLKATLAKASTAGAVERYSRSAPAFAVTSEVWDRDPFLLGTPDGTVDLRTAEKRPALPGDFITKSTAIVPADAPDCPLWLGFLEQACASNAETIRFLKQWCGYTLTGDTREHALLFIHGPGGNGKSVFLGSRQE